MRLRSPWSVCATAFLVAACAGGTGASPPTRAVEATATTAIPSAAPTSTTRPVPTNAAGIRTCVSSSEGPERECPLDAGTYATEGMSPALTYSVPTPGWSSLNRTAAPGNFHLFPPGGSMSGFKEGTTDAITVLSAVTPPGICTGLPSKEYPATFRGVMDFLQDDPHVVINNLADASVAGLSGKVMDVGFAEGDGCPDGGYADLLVGVDPSHGAVGVTAQTGALRLYLLRLPGSDHPLAILVDDAKNGGSDYGDDWLAIADGVIDTFVFAP